MPENEQKEFFTGEQPGGKGATGSREGAAEKVGAGSGGGTEGAMSVYGGPQPLAVRMRPRRLEEIVGQDHLLGADCLLPRLVRQDRFGSLLFYGPPGTGKTSLAEVIARETGSRFVQVNAVLSNTAEMRDILRMARYRAEEKTLVFIDEIHRFNKAQQDLLLPDVESGVIRLIGATTHNPGFYINAPLLSRSHLFRLEPVGESAMVAVLGRALADRERGLGGMGVTASEAVLGTLARMSEGDLRRALNALETVALGLGEGSGDAAGTRAITEAEVRRFAEERQIRYDAGEDEHYDTASALIKSLRGGDPDAALYWMARMLLGGEDPRFMARRLVIFASEDVGLADPRALPLAVAAKEACEFVGLPECELNLAHVCVFLACCPKSNSTTLALGRAKASIREKGTQPVPGWLRDSHTQLNRSLGHGEGYRYSHEWEEAISGQEYMVKPERFYEPTEAGVEARIAERLAHWRALKERPRRR